MIPFVDLPEQYKEIQADIEEDVLHILRYCDFVNGSFVERFELAFAQYLGANYVVGVSSGTDALMLAMEALGIGDKDQVIIPVNSFISSAFSISRCGAIPLFVDVDPDSYLLDLEQVEKILKKKPKKVKAIIAVHLYGQMPDMEALSDMAKQYKVFLIEDASQAIGATHQGKPVGFWSHIATTSFYPTRNLGTCGQGGAVIVNDRTVAERIKTIANQGSKSKYDHVCIGGNYRLDNIMAAQLYHAIKKINEWTANRRKIASYFNNAFSPDYRPVERPNSRHCYHLYEYKCSTSDMRNVLALRLKSWGIGFGFHYPTIITDTLMYKNLATPTPIASDLCGRLISLPMFPTMTEHQANQIIDSVLSLPT